MWCYCTPTGGIAGTTMPAQIRSSPAASTSSGRISDLTAKILVLSFHPSDRRQQKAQPSHGSRQDTLPSLFHPFPTSRDHTHAHGGGDVHANGRDAFSVSVYMGTKPFIYPPFRVCCRRAPKPFRETVPKVCTARLASCCFPCRPFRPTNPNQQCYPRLKQT